MESINESQKNNEIFTEEFRKNLKDFYLNDYKQEIEEGDIDKSQIDKKVEGEESFFLKVLAAIDKAKKENPTKKIVSLFDLDETLVKAKRINEDYEHVIRPSAVSLLKIINDKGGINGFLTGREMLEEQLENELKILSPFIDKNYLFSNGSMYVPMEEEKAIFEKNKNHSLAIGDIEKIHFINDLISKEEYANTIFIPIDDLQYPSLFPYGVALKDEEKFF